MRLLVVIAAAMALLSTAASAQSNPHQNPWQQLPSKVEKGDLPQDDGHAAKADDKAYRSALDGIPQVKGQDPWHSLREPPKSKSSR